MSNTHPPMTPSAPTPGTTTASSDERPIRFVHRGSVGDISGRAPTTTVLSWLREQAHCTGTKEGCNEGDCGACMVAVAELEPNGEVALRNVNACLLFLPVLDGKALFTVEDLTGFCAGALHPVQQALVDHHGSQCGFCTPGFVMTMWTGWEAARAAGVAPSRQEWADALAGNLCRCTGYRPIVDAAVACTEPSACRTMPGLNRSDLRAQLMSLQKAPALHYRAHDPGVRDARAFSAPRSSDELAACLQAHPGSRILGGATDIGLWTNKGHRDVGHLVYTGAAHDLRMLHDEGGWLRMGAAVSLEAAWQSLVRHWPALGDLWRRFASPPVRHAGTLAGNVANGSPIGDAPPVLMALDARLVLRRGAERRTVPLSAFYLSYQRNELRAGEFIEWVEVPWPTDSQVFRAWKLSKRYDSDISAVCAGFRLDFDPVGGLSEVRLAFGGMAATVQRATAAEQALLEQGWCEDGLRAAQAALAEDFRPLSDLRATAAYRMDAAQGLMSRLWHSLQPPVGSVPSERPDLQRLEVWR